MRMIEVFGGKVEDRETGALKDCPWCARAKALLVKRNLPHVYRDISEDAEAMKELSARAGAAKTIPQIFVGETRIGGFTDLAALERSGALQQMIAGA